MTVRNNWCTITVETTKKKKVLGFGFYWVMNLAVFPTVEFCLEV